MNTYKHSTLDYVDKEQGTYIKEQYIDNMRQQWKSNREKHPGALLLDSSLISPTHYDYKLIQCGDYVQIYQFTRKKTSYKDKKDKKLIDYDYLFSKRENVNNQDLKYIELKNINRSKFQLQRLVKSNEDVFKTFITLTFSDNITSIEDANKKFDIWRTKIKSIFKDFRYVCVPEFQKRGAVHYHLLTNLEINQTYSYIRRGKASEVKLIIPQIDNSLKSQKKCYDVKYWSYGFTSVFPLSNINVIGYITKYMTKDIDNRLWGKRRYLYSLNLKRPREILIDSDLSSEFSKIFEIESIYDICYQKLYYDLNEDPILFTEYKLNNSTI